MNEARADIMFGSALERYEWFKPYVIPLCWLGVVIGLGSYVTRIIWRTWIHRPPGIAESDNEERPASSFRPREWEIFIVFISAAVLLFYQYVSFDFLGIVTSIGLFLWNLMLGARIALTQLILPREPNRLVDLPNHVGQPFVPDPREYAALLGIIIGSYFNGLLSFWAFFGLCFGGFVWGWFPTFLFALTWLWRQSPKSVISGTRGLRWAGMRSEALAVLEFYAGLKPNDYAKPELLASKLQGRLGWLITQEPRYPLALADALVAVGGFSQIVALFEAIFGISATDYQAPPQLATKLQSFPVKLPAELAAKYVMNLVNSHSAMGAHWQGLMVLEAYLGLAGQDYVGPHALGKNLQERLRPFPDKLSYDIAFTLVHLLGMAGHSAYGLRLFEAYLGLPGGGDYTEPGVMAVAVARLKQLPANIGLPFGIVFVIALNNNERSTESGALLASWFGLTNNPHDVTLVQDILKQLPTNEQPLLVQLLANYWTTSGRHKEALALLEGHFKLKPSDYSSSHKLRERLKSLSPDTACACLLPLSNALSLAGRNKDALTLLESYLWLSPKLYRDARGLSRVLADRLQYLPAEMQRIIVIHYVYKLLDIGRHTEALLFQQAHLHLQPSDYAEPQRLAQALSSRLQGVSSTGASHYLEALVTVLEANEQRASAAMVLDIWMYLLVRPDDPKYEHGIDPPILCSMFDRWLQYFGTCEREPVLAICRFIIPQLRRSLAETGITLEDRSRFIKVTTGLRRRIIETGLHWLQSETNDARAAQFLLEVQLWDFELGQRILLERFLLGEIEKVVPATSPPGTAWPCLEAQPSSSGHLPAIGLDGTHRYGSDEEANVALLDELGIDANEEELKTNLLKLKGESQTTKLELVRRAKEIIQKGIDEPLLAQSLGKNTLLLRVTFDTNERLLWTALISDGNRVSIAATGSGQQGDLGRFRRATALHDFRIKLAWLQSTAKRRQLEKSIRRILEVLYEARSVSESQQKILQLCRQKLLAVLNETYESLHQQGLFELWETCCGRLRYAPENLEDYTKWAVEEAHWLDYMLGLISDKASKDSPQVMLNKITSEYVEETSSIWTLDHLVEAINPEMDVVLQVDDALHAVPIAYLPLAGHPFYQHVRSIRSSFSVLLTILQQEAEREFQKATMNSKRMLVVSWFDEDDRAREKVIWLHHGHFNLARQYGLECYAAADNPEGALGTISSALSEYGSFKVLTVCGHGNYYKAGVKLRENQLWDGSGCNLSQVELLLMVSCSIGRLNQTRDLDVEGFCVQLAIHKAPAMLACRWPVSCFEACAFANEIVHQHLRLREEFPGREVHTECLRARALNAARKTFLGGSAYLATQSSVGLNTAAAFELYGLG